MNEYVEYRSSLCSLKNLLGLGCLHLYTREELMPYITRILSKINEWLILEDKERLEDNIKLFVQYYEDGMDKFIDPDRVCEVFWDYGYDIDSPDVVKRYFTLAWTNVFSTIYLEELYNHAYLFTTSPVDCHECCGTIGINDEGDSIFIPSQNELSSPHVSCGCGRG